MDLFQKSKNKAVMTKSRIDLKISKKKNSGYCYKHVPGPFLSFSLTQQIICVSFLIYVGVHKKLGKTKCTFIKK